MYCINCGVKLADTEKCCPLCQTRVYHPDLMRSEGESLYPGVDPATAKKRSLWPQTIISLALLFPVVIILLSDWEFNRAITWSGYVIGAMLTLYEIGFLPLWFKNPNPVIFVPCGFVTVGLYLLYINWASEGDWFLTFAFPVLGGVALIVTAMVALLKYVRRGKLYIFGGGAIALGLLMVPVEFLLNFTFHYTDYIGWAHYPLVALVMVGGYLIFLAICRPARELIERKFFI